MYNICLLFFKHVLLICIFVRACFNVFIYSYTCVIEFYKLILYINTVPRVSQGHLQKTPKNEVIALTNHTDPPEIILEKLKNYGMTSFRKLSSSYKYCVIANGEFDIYADKVRANEWDDAAGHAIAEHAGALVTDLENNYFSYGREDYKNPTILIRRSENLNA